VASINAFDDDGMPHLAAASSRPSAPLRTIGALALFRVVNRYVGNLAPMPGVFPD
jgi:hypothetical protein